NGPLKAVTTNGDIIVRQAALSGQSSLETTNGSVRFQGSLDLQGTYKMKTNSGDVNLTLPSNTSFQLSATTGSGSVHNEFGSTIVGYIPRAQITVTIGYGSVTINKL
ncbi:MAG TPA: DUF4097 family beta strand repeat-containing protein, partial [Ktedonobacteraceae bacterium]|nr:DUF4097 family beta strand repeat-containing protein [Ktedonobacteraceae bacterium]